MIDCCRHGDMRLGNSEIIKNIYILILTFMNVGIVVMEEKTRL